MGRIVDFIYSKGDFGDIRKKSNTKENNVQNKIKDFWTEKR